LVTSDFEEWSDTDKAFTHFFQTCLEAGPDKCALAALNRTAAQLEDDAWAWFDSLRQPGGGGGGPIPAGAALVDYLAAKGLVAEMLKSPSVWPAWSRLLAVALHGTEAERDALWNAPGALEGMAGSAVASYDAVGTMQSLWGVHCGDRVPRLASFGGLVEVTGRLGNTSRLIGDVVQSVTTHCARWPWRAKEVYVGDFRVTTKNPVLLVGNVLDAHTPIRSAFNVSEGFEGSRVLVANGTGVSFPGVWYPISHGSRLFMRFRC
jgi:hypothetical protein